MRESLEYLNELIPSELTSPSCIPSATSANSPEVKHGQSTTVHVGPECLCKPLSLYSAVLAIQNVTTLGGVGHVDLAGESRRTPSGRETGT